MQERAMVSSGLWTARQLPGFPGDPAEGAPPPGYTAPDQPLPDSTRPLTHSEKPLLILPYTNTHF